MPRVVSDGELIEVIDDALDTWVVRFEPIAELQDTGGWSRAAAQGVATGLVEVLPQLRDALTGRGALRVVFSADVRKALASGSYRMMSNGLPVAVDQGGRIVEIARVPGATAAGAGAGAGLGLGAAGAVAWPVIVAAGVATAAAIAQQRWLERSFAKLGSQLDRIEVRLRDDDLGAIEAADSLVDLIALVGPVGLHAQLRDELALARHRVEGIYFSRRHFVDRVKRAIEAQQEDHEGKTGQRKAWVGDVVKQFSGDRATVDELVVFLRAMVSRARLGAATAALLAVEGVPVPAIRLLDQLHEGIRSDYWDLQRRLQALARTEPDSPLWRSLLDRADREVALANARTLSLAMQTAVGERLPERDEVLALEVDANCIEALAV